MSVVGRVGRVIRGNSKPPRRIHSTIHVDAPPGTRTLVLADGGVAGVGQRAGGAQAEARDIVRVAAECLVLCAEPGIVFCVFGAWVWVWV